MKLAAQIGDTEFFYPASCSNICFGWRLKQGRCLLSPGQHSTAVSSLVKGGKTHTRKVTQEHRSCWNSLSNSFPMPLQKKNKKKLTDSHNPTSPQVLFLYTPSEIINRLALVGKSCLGLLHTSNLMIVQQTVIGWRGNGNTSFSINGEERTVYWIIFHRMGCTRE